MPPGDAILLRGPVIYSIASHFQHATRESYDLLYFAVNPLSIALFNIQAGGETMAQNYAATVFKVVL
jgi:hypothetical protein